MKKLTAVVIFTLLLGLCACGSSNAASSNSTVRLEEPYTTVSSTEFSSDTNGLAYNDIEEIENSRSDTDNSNRLEIGLDSDAIEEIANMYIDLFNTGQWNGNPVKYNCWIEVDLYLGEIYINDIPTGIKLEGVALAEQAEEMYLSGEWDGTLITINDHEIYIEPDNGCFMVEGWGRYLGNADIPGGGFDIDGSDVAYIPQNGSFFIKDNRLYNILRGEVSYLPGSTLSWKGYVPDDTHTEYSLVPKLKYDSFSQKLFLFTYEKDGDTRRTYLYVFPDYNKSEIEYLGEILFHDVFKLGDGSYCGLYYVDTNNVAWLYTPQDGPIVLKEDFHN